jgi:hypothetical protein
MNRSKTMDAVNLPELEPTDAAALAAWQAQCTQRWHAQPSLAPAEAPSTNFQAILTQNHSHNVQLWQHEDKARRDDRGFAYVYDAKRAIDHHNQQRNNMMECMDAMLHAHFAFPPKGDVPLHSETPGMIIDRLSILALKCFHMDLQSQRQDTDKTHQQNCQHKSQVLQLQREHLTQALAQLFKDCMQGRRAFRLYKQMKMYNDPNLNPELYAG